MREPLVLSEDKLKIPRSQWCFVQKKRVRFLGQRPKEKPGRSSHGYGLGPSVFPLAELWFPEVVEERSRTEALKALGFPQESRGPQHCSFSQLRPILLVMWPSGCSLGALIFFLQL